MITRVRLQNFRSYKDATFDLVPGVNIIVGPNASGKTNLLEAVLVIARGKSFRAKDSELVLHDSTWMRIDAENANDNRTVKFQAEPFPQKTYELGGETMSRLHATKVLPVVLFEPNDLLLFSGAPDARRTFLDDILEHGQREYAATRRHYKRVLAQRNALLKRNPPGLAQQLFVWNIRLSELGGKLAKERHALVEQCNQHLSQKYAAIANKQTTVRLAYETRFDIHNYETQLLKKLEANPELEALRGFTAYGPHRDDLGAFIEEQRVQDAASRGEVRTLVLALKLLELEFAEQATGAKPLLLLDDVFSELDATRRKALTDHIRPYQTLITTTDADAAKSHFNHAAIIDLAQQR